MLNKKYFYLLIIFFASAALFATSYFFIPDYSSDFLAADYIKEFSVSLSDAHFPVYWFKNGNNGLGTPVSTAISPLPALTTAPFLVLGLSPNLVLSLYILAIFLLTALNAFNLANRKFSNKKTFLFTILFLVLQSVILLPKTYTSLSLITFISILPYFLQKLSESKTKKSELAKLSLVLSALILSSHTLFIIFLGSFFTLSFVKQKNLLFSKILLWALLTTSFFWAPLFSELNLISKSPNIENSNGNSPFYKVEGNANITEEVNKTGEKFVQLNHKEPLKFTFNSHYYPGWKLYVNDIQVEPVLGLNKLPSTSISPEGGDQKNIKFLLQNTPIKSISIILSLISVITLLFFTVYNLVGLNLSKTVGIVSVIVFTFNISLALLGSENKFQSFDPKYWESKYLQSQWVNPQSKHPIGDHGLYAWAGWAYFHGENPILINSEMPPLGKYIIGLGLTLTRSAFVTGLLISAFTFISVYLLSRKIFKSAWLAFVPLSLLSFERIVTSSLTLTMLDGLLVGFLAFYFYFLIDAKTWKSFIFAALMLGGVLTSKFYATGILVAASSIFYYTLTTNWSKLFKYLFTLPFAGLVHLVSYLRYFMLGGSLWGYLGIQKYIFTFYSQGGPRVPFGSYWLLVFFNKWRVWWGPVWGEFYTLTTKEWRPTWPIGAISSLVAFILLFKRSLSKYQNKIRNVPDFYLIVSWILTYSSFLSLIGGWPHYMMMFLPFSAIICIKLIIDYHKIISKLFNPLWLKLKPHFL